jgi:hypothetical protein
VRTAIAKAALNTRFVYAEANLKMIRIVGWLIPHSIRLTKLRSMPAVNANCSCDILTSFRRTLSTFSNATAGSRNPSQYIGRDSVEMYQSSLHNILVILGLVERHERNVKQIRFVAYNLRAEQLTHRPLLARTCQRALHVATKSCNGRTGRVCI